MAKPATGAERYLAQRMKDPAYRAAYADARARIDRIDSVIRALDARRDDLQLTKADLARRAGVKPEAIRRLFSAERPNPTLATLIAVADALDMDLHPVPRADAPATRAPSDAAAARRRSA